MTKLIILQQTVNEWRRSMFTTAFFGYETRRDTINFILLKIK